MSEEPDVVAHRRRFIREFDAAYCIPDEWDVIRVFVHRGSPDRRGNEHEARLYVLVSRDEEYDPDA